METAEKSIIRRFYEITNAGRPEDLDEVCAPDLKGHAGAGADLAELKSSIAGFLAPFPDLHRAAFKCLLQFRPEAARQIPLLLPEPAADSSPRLV